MVTNELTDNRNKKKKNFLTELNASEEVHLDVQKKYRSKKKKRLFF